MMEHRRDAARLLELADDLTGSIGRAVVDDDQLPLERAKVHGHHARDNLAHRAAFIERGDDDRQFHCESATAVGRPRMDHT